MRGEIQQGGIQAIFRGEGKHHKENNLDRALSDRSNGVANQTSHGRAGQESSKGVSWPEIEVKSSFTLGKINKQVPKWKMRGKKEQKVKS